MPGFASFCQKGSGFERCSSGHVVISARLCLPKVISSSAAVFPPICDCAISPVMRWPVWPQPHDALEVTRATDITIERNADIINLSGPLRVDDALPSIMIRPQQQKAFRFFAGWFNLWSTHLNADRLKYWLQCRRRANASILSLSPFCSRRPQSPEAARMTLCLHWQQVTQR